MSIFKLASIAALALGVPLIVSGNAIAAIEPVTAADRSTQVRLESLLAANPAESKPELNLKNSSTYEPPDNGGPDRTQGSGTR